MTNKKRITWEDIFDKLGDCSGSYMGKFQREEFRSALIKTGYYQDELQIYETVARQSHPDILQKYIDAIREVAGE